MTIEDLQTLFDYGYWANAGLHTVLSQLTTEQFILQVAGSYGSIRNTMVHMLSAEWGWLERCGGTARGPALNAQDYPSVAALFDRWRHVERHMREFLRSLGDQDLSRVVEFSIGGGPRQTMALGDLLHHAAIHGIHHRGQVALLLRAVGHVPGNVDILLYYARRSAAKPE
ncbi:MAG TPA: DinB family protein [Vicinamibacterales bacterium]